MKTFWAVTVIIIVLIALAIGPLLMRQPGDGYNFSQYSEVNFSETSAMLAPPDLFPVADVFTVAGDVISIAELWVEKPLVIEFGSRSCPIYLAGGLNMDQVSLRRQNDANFIVLYVNEAHPGVLTPHLQSLDEKLQRASAVAAKITRDVYIDNLAGDLHRQLGQGPNSVYIVDTDGRIAYSAYWTDPNKVEQTLARMMENDFDEGDASFADRFDPCPLPNHLTTWQLAKSVIGITWVGGVDAFFDFLWNGLRRATGNQTVLQLCE